MRREYFSHKLLAATLLPLGLFAGCSGASTRPQLLVYIDTDAPITLQAASDPTLSAEAAIDRVRVEQLDARGNVENARIFTAPSALDWPLSFGLVTPAPVTLRIRAYRARDAQAATSAGALDEVPDPATTIDRLVTLTPPGSGIEPVVVFLASECFNAPASLLEPRTTCVDAARQGQPPSAHLSYGTPPAISRIGTWPGARETPCKGPGAPGRVCVPGGFSRIGQASNIVVPKVSFELPQAPARPVRVSPFFLDRTEFTVGRARPWLASLKALAPIKKGGAGSGIVQDCTLTDTPDSDRFPLNCIMADAAQELCERVGGTLPTEAQWNHAASGRGERRLFPWGDAVPSCCSASISRISSLDEKLATCKENGSGPGPVGSHLPTPECPHADSSRDGVLDLAGSVAEILADIEDSFDGPCWSTPGVLIDPVCRRTDLTGRVLRGASYDAGMLTTFVAGRNAIGTTNAQARAPNAGFRCAYPDR